MQRSCCVYICYEAQPKDPAHRHKQPMALEDTLAFVVSANQLSARNSHMHAVSAQPPCVIIVDVTNQRSAERTATPLPAVLIHDSWEENILLLDFNNIIKPLLLNNTIITPFQENITCTKPRLFIYFLNDWLHRLLCKWIYLIIYLNHWVLCKLNFTNIYLFIYLFNNLSW